MVPRIRLDNSNDLNENLQSCVDSYVGKFYICLTCGRELQENVIWCQIVGNQLALERVPSLLF